MKKLLTKILILVAMIATSMRASSQTQQIEITDSMPEGVQWVIYTINHFVEDLDKAENVEQYQIVLGSFNGIFPNYHDTTPIDADTRTLFTKANRVVASSILNNMMRVTGTNVADAQLNMAINKLVDQFNDRLAKCNTVGEYICNALLLN